MTSKLRELAEVLIKADTNDRLSKTERVEVQVLLRQSKRFHEPKTTIPEKPEISISDRY
jgi:hypothetical protein